MDDACRKNSLIIFEKKAGLIRYHIFPKMQIGGRASTAAVPGSARARDMNVSSALSAPLEHISGGYISSLLFSNRKEKNAHEEQQTGAFQ